MSLIAELRRRNVFKVAAAYLLASWVVVEVASVVLPIMGAPNWLLQALLFAIALGLPIVLIFSWVFEVTPTGIMKTEDVTLEHSITADTGRRLNYVIIGLLVVAVAVLAVTHRGFDRDAATTGPPPNSIAVLPFVNLSSDQEQEYFSDGLAEELLNLLANVAGLRVTSRTSAFSFKDRRLDIPTVAAQLNVAHILEGSVRRSGARVRITAQLIDARDDVHVWSETFDRPLDDIFLVQDEIAGAVVSALKVRLLHGAPKASVTHPEAYALYLQARHSYRLGSPDSFRRAESLLRQSIGIEPDYAPAWESLSTVYSYQVLAGLLPFDEGRARAREAVERALQIDPDYALAHGQLGWDAMTLERDYAAAVSHFRRARSLAPRNAAVLGNSGLLAFILGRLDEGLELIGRARELDPVDPAIYSNLAAIHLAAADLDAAEAMLDKALILSPIDDISRSNLALLRILQRRAEDALAEAGRIESRALRLIVEPLALYDLGRLDESDTALSMLAEEHGTDLAYYVAAVHAWRGEPDEAFLWLNRAIDEGQDVSTIKTDPFLRGLHDDPRWSNILTTLGLSDAQVATLPL